MTAEPKIMILTGASQGIGHAIASRFMNEGWQVLSVARQDMPPECRRNPLWTKHIPADLSDPASLDDFLRQSHDWLDGRPIGALINNAGVSPKTPFAERLGVLNGAI